MAAKTTFQPAEIPVLERTRHTMFSFDGQSEVERNSLFDDSVSLLSADMTLDGFDLKTMFEEYDPQQLIQVIGKHGVLWLGTMNIEEWLVEREFGGRTTITMGTDEINTQDWEKMWMDHLMGGGKRYDIASSDRLVQVEAFVVTIKNASGVRNQGLLFPLLQRWEANACPIEIWGLATVRALVSYKWNHWAKRYVMIQFALYVLWVMSFLALALGYHPNDLGLSPAQLWSRDDGGGGLTVCAAVACQLFMFPFTFICIRRMIGAAFEWYNFWDFIDVLTQFMQINCTIVYLLETNISSSSFNVLLGIQTILLIAKIQFFARAFVAVESSMLDTLKAVVGGIRWYLLLLALTVYSFSCAFYILFRGKYSECNDFSTMIHSAMSMYSLMLGEWEMDQYLRSGRDETAFQEWYHKEFNSTDYSTPHYLDEWESHKKEYPPNSCFIEDTCRNRNINCHETDWGDYRPTLETQAIMFFLCVYMVLMSILFYHLLIAMVIDSHARQMEVRKLWVHLSRAEIINILETALPRFLTERYSCPYIHVLRIVPVRDANYEKIWRQIDETDSSISVNKEHIDHTMNDVENDIMSRIEGISDKIRGTVGYPPNYYKELVYRKLGLAQRSEIARLRSAKSMRLSKRLTESQSEKKD